MTGCASVRGFCRGILERGDLAAKLTPASVLDDAQPGEPLQIARPARLPELALGSGAGPLPRPSALGDPEARALCLARFAHHELMAVELFAWALLRWPALPAALRRGMLSALADEQTHCRLYLERLEALGRSLADFGPHSDYFWKQADAIARSPQGPRAFLAGLGLTLEQANLDFSLIYRDAFRSAGDEPSAAVCQRIHDEEIVHVALAARWLERLSPSGQDEVERYERSVPFPLCAARAKGRRFDTDGRRRAGLGEALIEHVRRARPAQNERRAPGASG